MKRRLRLVSWNVNGYRAVVAKGFADIYAGARADCFCLQETKMKAAQCPYVPDGVHAFWAEAEKAGYAGVGLLSVLRPRAVYYGISRKEHDSEGRVITADMGPFYLVVVYTPNSQDGLRRLPYRQEWDKAFADYVCSLDAVKPVIICGDLNVAHQDIDLRSPKTNRQNPGFTDQERQGLTDLLARGFVDTFRHFWPEKKEAYTWWSYRYGARAKNIGWRIDYFLASERLVPMLEGADIMDYVTGSDHCPVSLELTVDWQDAD